MGSGCPGACGVGPTLASADFRDDDVAGVLEAIGHDARQPTLFICEGLLVYLDQPTCVRLLGALRARAAIGSELAVSLATLSVTRGLPPDRPGAGDEPGARPGRLAGKRGRGRRGAGHGGGAGPVAAGHRPSLSGYGRVRRSWKLKRLEDIVNS